MYISMNWISDFVDLSGVDLKELIGRFTLATAEVEDIYEFGKDIQGVVVGQIVSHMARHSSKSRQAPRTARCSDFGERACPRCAAVRQATSTPG